MMKRKHNDVKDNPSHQKADKMKSGGMVGDPRLISRIRQYLEANKRKAAVSVTLMSDDLQTRYSDYARKKKDPFRKCVEKAYRVICEQSGDRKDKYSALEKAHLQKRRKKRTDGDDSADSDTDSSDGGQSFSSDNPDYVPYQDTNSMNSFMTDMYKKTPKQPASQPVSATNSRHGSPVRSQSNPPSPRWGEVDTECFVLDRTGNKKTKAKSRKKKTERPQSLARAVVDKREVIEIDFEESSPMPSPSRDSNPGAEWCQTGSPCHKAEDSKVSQEKSHKRSATPEKQADRETDGTGKTPKSVKKKAKTKDSDEVKKKGPAIQQSQVKFADIGGNDATLRDVCKLLVHMKHPEVYQQLGVTPPRGFLLHGPPGCGKTLLANAIAGELELPFIKMAATEIVSGVSGESEEKVRDVFEKAMATAPCIIFLDEIDAITQKRETASKDMERRIVSQLLTCMDDLNSSTASPVLVIGATNRPDSLDPALRRAGRFDREICLGIPDESARQRILRVLCRDLKLEGDFDFHHLARATPGFVGADLMSLAREAAITAVNRVFHKLQSGSLTTEQSSGSSQNMETDSPSTSAVTGTGHLTECMDSETAGSQPETAGSQPETAGSQPETAGSQPETAGSQPKTTGSQPDTAVVQLKTADVQSDTAAVQPETADSTEPTSSISTGQTSGECQPHAEHTTASDHGDGAAGNLATLNLSRERKSVCDTTESLSTATAEFQLVLRWLKDQPPLNTEQLQNLWITKEDFESALQVVQPSAKREGFATIPDVTWADIGALHAVREELQLAILAPVRHPEQFKALGLTNPPGILLAGPPGCGKTLLAKAVANESGINFISVKGPELLNMYVGESERAVRQVFQRARNSSPCVIFFDELDALCPRRSHAGEGGASVRVVNQLLTEMDGLEERKQVFLMAATNRPDIIDPAILRPGRLDKILYVGLPQPEERWDILKTITKNGTKPTLAEDVDLKEISSSEHCTGYTGADLAALVREASVAALKQFMLTSNQVGSVTSNQVGSVKVTSQHFQTALEKIKPSVSDKDQIIYKKMREAV